MIDTAAVRAVARDGALLFFDRSDGANVLVRGPSTRALRARAPRVVMFGITNACNLRCAFCSRDLDAASGWDEESAFDVLAGLCRAGVLEVALGGGEPLAFRGIERLLARLHHETELAVHLTTNAILLDDARLARIRGHVGEIRVSIYEDNPWPERIAALAAIGGSFGANVLVTPDRIDALPGLLARLEDLGCPDVALLRYVGPDASRSLAPADLARVAAIAQRTTMRVRASVCFGEGLALPMLEVDAARDCGAGGDFVVVGSDRTIRACSFSREAIPITDADDVIAVWRRERSRLSARVDLYGCAREHDRAGWDRDGARVWRAFSGNNSGDCFLVGKFESADQAASLVESLREGYVPGQPFSEPWIARLARDGIEAEPGERMPEHLEAVGRSVLAHTASSAEDDFPALRALVWRLRGRVVANGIHVHDAVQVVTALAIDDASAREQIDVRAAIDDLGSFVEKGEVLYGMRTISHRGLGEDLEIARRVVASGDIAAAELVAFDDPPPLAELLAARPSAPTVEWLVAYFRDADRASAFAQGIGPRAASSGRTAIVRSKRASARDALHVARSGGVASVIEGELVVVGLHLWHPTRFQKIPIPLDRAPIESELRAELGHQARFEESRG